MAGGLAASGGASGWQDALDGIPILDGFVTSSDEQAQMDAAAEAEIAWNNILYNGMPSQGDLQGYDLYGVPQEYIDQYIADHTANPEQWQPGEGAATAQGDRVGLRDRPGGGRFGGQTNRAGDLEAEAREAYYREQLANDPLWGLQVADQSQLEGAAADPYSIESQRRALQQMQGIYDAGGYTDTERAQLQLSQRDAAMGERSQRLAALEGARARGMGGGGMELMGALAAQQGGANRASDWANQIAIAGQQRALQALQNSGQMASQMRSQSFGEDSGRRAAADAWNQYQTGLIQQRQAGMGDAAQQGFNNQVTATAGLTGQLANTQQLHGQREEDAEQSGAAVFNTVLGAATGGMTGAAGAAAGGMTGRTTAQQPNAPQYELPSYYTGRTGRRY